MTPRRWVLLAAGLALALLSGCAKPEPPEPPSAMAPAGAKPEGTGVNPQALMKKGTAPTGR